MELTVDHEILKAYGLQPETVALQKIGSGHINVTYLATVTSGESYILQGLNTDVFKDPAAISNNIEAVATYLKQISPFYLFPAPLPTLDSRLITIHKGTCWRLMPFISNTIALDTLTDPKQAFEAAKQFGKLSKLLAGFDASRLQPTIQGFHDLAWRYEQFTFALIKTTKALKEAARNEIEAAQHHHFILAYFKSYQQRKDFPDRVMHHDTKISNVLLAQSSFDGVCVIDLDTLMPGKFISDLGDMIRTYVSAFSENETDLDKIKIRLPYFKATIAGYLAEMGESLTETEKELILFSGKYMVYMQALRFLTDYLNGSIYYPIAYATQNLDRSKNQFKLLHELFENEKVLQDIIESHL